MNSVHWQAVLGGEIGRDCIAVGQELAASCVIYECECVWNFLENAKFFTKKYEKNTEKISISYMDLLTFCPAPFPPRPGDFDNSERHSE